MQPLSAALARGSAYVALDAGLTMDRVLVLSAGDVDRSVRAAIGSALSGPIIICVDVARDRTEIPILGWTDGDKIQWRAGDVKGLLNGAYARAGWASRCIDPASGLWETYRVSRRAARRQRGRDRAAARTARQAVATGRRLADRLAAALAAA